eukprot:9002811-Alexandrium_andersonii.AAC.1
MRGCKQIARASMRRARRDVCRTVHLGSPMCGRERSKPLAGMRVGAQFFSRTCTLKAACAQERRRQPETARASCMR